MKRHRSAPRAATARSIEQALALHRQGRLNEAGQIYDAILSANPIDFDALHLGGVLKHQQGRSAEALRLVAAALKVRPDSADVLTNYGVILEALKHHQEALESFEKALAMRAGDAAALHYNRGNALKHLGRRAEALAS
jgi:tetratricopeptide (TPR) repeat protein